RAAVVACILEIRFLGRRGDLSQSSARRTVCARVLGHAQLTDPAAEFIPVETRVAAIGERRKGAAAEGEERRIRPFGRSRRVPGAGQRTHAANGATAEQAHDVDLVCALAEYHSTAALGDELFRPARTIQKVGV